MLFQVWKGLKQRGRFMVGAKDAGDTEPLWFFAPAGSLTCVTGSQKTETPP